MLADSGHLDVAHDVLLQDTEPSWLTMIERGATTVREHWDGARADGTAHDSLNHYSEGAVVGWELDAVGDLVLDVTVPAGTRAEVVLPDGRSDQAGPGRHRLRCRLRKPVTA